MNIDMDEFASNAIAELEMTEAQLRDAEAAVVALRARRDGLRFTVKYAQDMHAAQGRSTLSPTGAKPSVPAVPGVEVSQTDRVLDAMTQIGRAAMTTEIRDRVNAHTAGPKLDTAKVRSALGYLMRKRPPRVERVRSGLWRLPKEVPSPAPFVPAGLTATSANGKGGS